MTSYEKLKAKVAIYEEFINHLDYDLHDLAVDPDAWAECGESLSDPEKKLMVSLSHHFTDRIYQMKKEIWNLK